MRASCRRRLYVDACAAASLWLTAVTRSPTLIRAPRTEGPWQRYALCEANFEGIGRLARSNEPVILSTRKTYTLFRKRLSGNRVTKATITTNISLENKKKICIFLRKRVVYSPISSNAASPRKPGNQVSSIDRGRVVVQVYAQRKLQLVSLYQRANCILRRQVFIYFKHKSECL